MNSYHLDHILTLQHALAHYERMLSQSHPTYILQLRASIATTKSDTDKAIMMLSILSLGILFSQVLTGMFVFHFEVLYVEKALIHRGRFNECDPPTQLTRTWGQTQWLWGRHRAGGCYNWYFCVDRATLVVTGEEKTQSHALTHLILIAVV